MPLATITPSELAARRDRGEAIELIDVRTPVEFQEVRAPLAHNMPLHSLDPAAIIRSRGDRHEQPLYLICKSGSRGRQACEKFITAGFTNVVNVEGGTSAWVASGLPVIRGTARMSLERQVRIAAGALVLLGTILGAFVSPYLLGIAAFVGAGLMFAGITDTCGMGLMLARMPWNRTPACPTAAATPSSAFQQAV